MLNEILDGITDALYEEFGDDYNIYIEEEEQSVQEPCFFVNLLETSNFKKIMGRYYSTNSYCITYYPKTEQQAREENVYYDPNVECNTVTDRLTECLEYITLNSGVVLHGTEIKAKVSNKILSFFVDYDCITKNATLGELMQEQKLNQVRK